MKDVDISVILVVLLRNTTYFELRHCYRLMQTSS